MILIKKKLIVFCIVLLLITLILLLYSQLITSQKNRSISPQATLPLVIDSNLGHTPTPAPPEPGVAIPGWSSIILPAGKLEADVDLFNPQDNQGWYYLTFQLRLKETGEIIFQTGLIPPSLRCTKVDLYRSLESGEYNGVMHVQPYYIKEPPTPTNNADFDIQIIVR